ncbi:MAG: RNA methyltransferase [Candidatus Eisenbacteria bacterium]|nr:RNA methyltransferase [Candidatus Eisenbacteria bacterium]
MFADGPFWIDRKDAPSREEIRFVLIGTTEPGNIGASARAIKAMGFGRLVLVSPPEGWRTPHAEAMAHGAEEILDGAETHGTVEEATAGCAWVVGTTRRTRRHHAEIVTPREWSGRLASIPGDERVAILFGPEKTGLSNEDVLRCRLIITVPTPMEHPSLNLAQAVMLLAYETALALREPAESVARPKPATAEELERLYETMDHALRVNEFEEKRRVALVRHLRLILHRAQLSAEETQTFFTLASRIRGPRPRGERRE